MSEVVNRRGGARVRVPPPAVFLSFLGLGLLLDEYVWALTTPPAARLFVGVPLLLAGVALCAVTLLLFQRSGQEPEPWKPTPTLIAAGPYTWSRNPMYLGMVLVHVGVALVACSGWGVLLAGPALRAVHHLAVLPEERYLAHRFGDSYRSYMEAVPRYLGRRRAGGS